MTAVRWLASIICLAVIAGGAWYWFGDHLGPAADNQDRGAAGMPGAGPAGARSASPDRTGSRAGGRPGGRPGGRGGFSRSATVTLAPLSSREIIESIEAVGTAQANESVTLNAKVTETVRRIRFEDGDRVSAGTVLVELTKQEETAQLAEAQANLDEAKRQADRFGDLAAQGSAPVSQLDEARARLRGAEARLEGILARLSDRLIRAPFVGVLGFREISPGTLVTPGTRITTIDDVSVIKLDFSVPETYFSSLKPGMAILAQSAAWPDREFKGIVRTVGSRVDPVTRAVEVRAHVDNSDDQLRPGMLLTVSLVRSQRSALAVPEAAVIQIGTQAYVYVATEDGRARRTAIQAGSRQRGFVEVLGGVPPGTQVVVDGVVKVRDGAQINGGATARAQASTSDRPSPGGNE